MMGIIREILILTLAAGVYADRIPVAWLTSKVHGQTLELHDRFEDRKITELQAGVFTQVQLNVSEVDIWAHLVHIEHGAFTGLEGISSLILSG